MSHRTKQMCVRVDESTQSESCREISDGCILFICNLVLQFGNNGTVTVILSLILKLKNM